MFLNGLSIMAIFIVTVLGCKTHDLRPEKITSELPYKFKYVNNDWLNVDIVLLNIAPIVTSFDVYYQPANCPSRSDSERVLGPSCKATTSITVNINGTDKKRIIQKLNIPLILPNIEIYIELKETNKICASKKILAGDKSKSTRRNDGGVCLRERPCEMEVDFKRECDSIVNIDDIVTLNCELYPETSINTIFQWYQIDEKGTQIGVIPRMESRTSHFTLKCEHFDDNTAAFCRFNNIYNYTVNSSKVRLHVQTDITEYNYKIQKYNEIEEVLFDCSQYLVNTNFIQVVWIDSTRNIITYNNVTLKKRFKMADNATLLYCFYYMIEGKDTVRRYVERKSMLIYNENTSSDIGDNNIMFYIIGCVVAAVILLVILAIICKRRPPDTGPTLELNTYDTSNRVLYAELEVMQRDGQFTKHTEESPYVEVIGVLKQK